jgi:biopolymer transport protein ExbD
MRIPTHRESGSLDVKMTPMIDVVFLLLIFFVWTSSFEQPEFDLPGAIAEAPATGSRENSSEPPPLEAFDEIIIKLLIRDGLPVTELGGRQVESLEELRQRIDEILSLDVQPPVIIDPEPEVEMDRAVEIYDVVREAGADRVLYATASENPGQ